MASSVFIGYFGGAQITYDGTTTVIPSALAVNSLVFSATNQDVSLSRGAASRLDLASGDSLYIVSGGLGVGVTPPGAGIIQANASILAGASSFIYFNGRSTMSSSADGVLVFANNAATAATAIAIGPAASATSTYRLVKKVTGIADAVATDVITVTVPNASQAAGVKLSFLSSNGSTDAFESSRVAEGFVVLARTSGVATVAAVAALDLAQIATVGGGATHTLAYGVSAIAGLASTTQTFTIQVTINDSGNVGSNQVVVVAEVINSEASGVTIA